MEWMWVVVAIAIVCSISSKVDAISKKIDNLEYGRPNSNNRRNNLLLDEYIGKKVTIEIDNDDIENSYLFDSTSDTKGEIIEYDDEWLLFKFYHKQKKKNVEQYLRRRDLVSINEVSKD